MKPAVSESTPPPLVENLRVGIGWMVLTIFLFVSLDTTAKYLMQYYSVVQVVWARFFLHVLWVLVFMKLSGEIQLRSNRISLQLLRSCLLLTVTIFFFTGISQSQLATASVIMFLAPILVTILAIPLLGESVGPRRWMGVLIGFVGALITIRPGMSGFHFGMVFLLIAALCQAMYLIVTRKARAYDPPLTALFYTGLAGAIGLSFVVPYHWTTPGLYHAGLFLLAGFLGSASHLCLIRAFRAAPASAVAPYSYTSLVWSVCYGFVIFGELPDLWVYVGAALIICSGLYIFYREQQLAKSAPES